MPRPRIHEDRAAAMRSWIEKQRAAHVVCKTIRLSTDLQDVLAKLRDTWGLTSDQATFERLLQDAGNKSHDPKNSA